MPRTAYMPYGVPMVTKFSPVFAQMIEQVLAQSEKEPLKVSGAEGVTYLRRHIQAEWDVSNVIVVGSDQVGLSMLLTAAGVTPGTRVLAPALASPMYFEAINALGAYADLVDIDENTWTIDPRCAESLVLGQTKAIIASHAFGFAPDMKELLAVAERHGLTVIEDGTWSAGGRYGGIRYQGRAVGSVGHFGYIACSYETPLRGISDSALLFCDDPALRQRLEDLVWTATLEQSEQCAGMNPYEERLLLLEMSMLPKWNERRKAISNRYREGLSSLPCKLPPDYGESYSSLFPLTLATLEVRDGLLKSLNEEGIAATRSCEFDVIESPLQGQEHRAQSPTSLLTTHSLLSQTLCLPCLPDMTDEEVEVCIAAVQSYFRSGDIYTLTPDLRLVVNGSQGTVSSLVHEAVVACQVLTANELSLLVLLLEAFPYYCPHELALARLTGAPIEVCRQQIEAADEQTLKDLLKDARTVLSGCRKKVLFLGLDLMSILETGWIARALPRKKAIVA